VAAFSDLSIAYKNHAGFLTRVLAHFYEGEWVDDGAGGWRFDRTLLESRTVDFEQGEDDAAIAERLDDILAGLSPYPKVGDAPG